MNKKSFSFLVLFLVLAGLSTGCGVTRITIDGDKVSAFRGTLLTNQSIGHLDAQLGTGKHIKVDAVKMTETKAGGAIAEAANALK